MQNTELPPYDAFYSKRCFSNSLETEYTDYVNLLKSGLTTEQAVIKLNLWNRELSLLATDMEAKTNELIRGLFAAVKQ